MIPTEKRKYRHVAVIMGGASDESDISVQSGVAVSDGLESAGYRVSRVTLDAGNNFEIPEGVEAVFIALHGAFGEDGQVQRRLREAGLPYTGSDENASRTGFDKILARAAFAKAGIRIPRGMVIDPAVADAPLRMRPPVVVKPPRQGSSVGVSVVRSESDFPKAVAEARKYCPEVLVEEYIPGREWSVPILGRNALPPVEITPANGWYNWNAKYFSGGTTSYTFPDDRPEDNRIVREASDLALMAFDAVGARGVSRVDFRISPDGQPFVIEINTIPGCTRSSILPKSAVRAGIPFDVMCAAIMEDAVCG